jgi:hypothetical protein
MRQYLSRAERIIRACLGLVILAVGIYGMLISPWPGLLVIVVGAFTVFEGCTGWTFVAMLTETWVRPDGGNLEMPPIKKQKLPAPEKFE